MFVLVVLAGVLGMHGLGTVSTPLAERPTSHAASGMPASGTASHGGLSGNAAAATETAQHACDDGQGSTPAPHDDHADEQCLSGAVPGPPAPPALSETVLSPTAAASTVSAPTAYEPVGGRAPPTLAELQLLRI
ncbi:hypothetical protein DVA86_18830 [Streptomyces armeniacus]|uniref:Uncharacterized protein n=1 Tax=Streptomyces armeniacus TaxID=83291 RepID=A0A345XRY0_9ACTN|nr:hypothetical protein DVA86_18830 [Streptomyces armeniacus]